MNRKLADQAWDDFEVRHQGHMGWGLYAMRRYKAGDDPPHETTLRMMDHSGKPGEQGFSGRGLLTFASRIHLLVGFTPDQIGRQYRLLLGKQGATGIELMI